jgi:23S rRNA (cytosine1962-C5)-methyltransferase
MVGLRILSRDENFSLSDLDSRFVEVARKKFGRMGGERSACRILNGEGDGFPGLTCDRYSDTLVWQPYLEFWDSFLSGFASAADSIPTSQFNHIVKNPIARDEKRPCYTLSGRSVEEPLPFEELGVNLLAYPVTGQKTGFFLDLGEVRKVLAGVVGDGDKVLNCFSNSGSFTVIAKLAGAGSVLSVDIDPACRLQWRSTIEANRLAFEDGDWVTDDVWDFLVEARLKDDRYDLIILDPPNMCARRSSLKPALKGWQKLVSSSLPLLTPGGALLIINCSSMMTRKICEESIDRLGAGLSIEATGSLPPDHTVIGSFPEGSYLKWWLYRRLDGSSA